MIQTPCRNYCKVSDNGYCVGCLRSLEEIANWKNYTDEERELIMIALEHRHDYVN
jgi:predicted Fe-S protein YdhL (DUF1289 family)